MNINRSSHPIFAAVLLFALSFFLRHANARQLPENDLTVHEWGTFTSIAGPDGLSVDWLPLTGSTDLPSFVEHFRSVAFKGGLRGTVRMETPVLYFYSPGETTVSVNVSFAKGLITEWYPHADSANPALTTRDYSLYNKKSPGTIAWNSVHIEPHGFSDFPTDNSKNHYFAARNTSSSSLFVETSSGPQREKFLFYRGVSAFSVSVNATVAADSTVHLQNQLPEEIPAAILFERRGAQLGYRMLGPIRDQAAYALPELSASLDSLSTDLEGILISQGLFPDEAHSMLETWRNSWFEEGSRLIYIVPRRFIDSILPLRVTPGPAATTRVFVGRLELITPATEHAVESAFAANDQFTLAKYNRFLEPILRTMLQKSTDPSRNEQLGRYLQDVYARLYASTKN
ncbi:MAG TPA: hypothetical protein VNY24_13245 [Candidatus Acidoferrales bacterium]|jgi:hypothetical protein|nr:hypothetical protein [Candidatus Acidoferrales bacterium]